jgi:hypothetical protein
VDTDTRKVIAWLNGPEGRRWSYLRHKQGAHARRWFSYKADQETFWNSDVQNWDNGWDGLTDVKYVDLGWYNPETNRYNCGPRHGMLPYRTGK